MATATAGLFQATPNTVPVRRVVSVSTLVNKLARSITLNMQEKRLLPGNFQQIMDGLADKGIKRSNAQGRFFQAYVGHPIDGHVTETNLKSFKVLRDGNPGLNSGRQTVSCLVTRFVQQIAAEVFIDPTVNKSITIKAFKWLIGQALNGALNSRDMEILEANNDKWVGSNIIWLSAFMRNQTYLEYLASDVSVAGMNNIIARINGLIPHGQEGSRIKPIALISAQMQIPTAVNVHDIPLETSLSWLPPHKGLTLFQDNGLGTIVIDPSTGVVLSGDAPFVQIPGSNSVPIPNTPPVFSSNSSSTHTINDSGGSQVGTVHSTHSVSGSISVDSGSSISIGGANIEGVQYGGFNYP